MSISHEFNQPSKPPSVHFGQHNEGQFVVQLLNPWLQTIESHTDRPGISIENSCNIPYLLRLSFFFGGGEIQSPRWILLFKKVSCFSNPSISWISSVVADFKLSSNMLAYWDHAYIHLWTPRAALKLSTLECGACVSRPRILCVQKACIINIICLILYCYKGTFYGGMYIYKYACIHKFIIWSTLRH